MLSARRCCILLMMFLPSNMLAQITLIGTGTLPGTSSDLSGLTGNQTDGTPHNRLGGLGSGIAYSGQGNNYVLVSDRGPKDGATDYACRFHRMQIRVSPGASHPVELKLTETTMLTNEEGIPFVGTLTAFDPVHQEKSLRLDAEGIRVSPSGNLYIADEYGPVVAEFSPQGKLLHRIPVPKRFLVSHVAGKPEEEMPPKNLSGRQPNRGMEGLAISPDGSKLYGIMQSPLIQDGGLDRENKRIGHHCRILEITLADGKTREFLYTLDDAVNGISEILAVNDHSFLVLERDSKGGLDARTKKVFLIDLRGASDVSQVNSVPAQGLPAGVKPVSKKLFLDMLDPVHKLNGADFPEKVEGLAFGPDLPNGQHLLIVTADNDFIATAPFRAYAFAVDRSALPDYQVQQFSRK